MFTRLPRTVVFSTRRGMSTYRKVREPYNLKKKQPNRQSNPSFDQKTQRSYAPVDSTTSFGLRPPEKEPWRADDDRFDTLRAREVDKPIGGAARHHLVVRPSKKDGDAVVAGRKDLGNQAGLDGMPLRTASHPSETQPFESSPSTPTKTLESLIPRGQPFKFSRDDSGNFPTVRQRLPDGTYEGQSQCIFLGNVPFELLMDKRDIWNRFQSFGDIRDIRIPVIKPTNAPKGFCYIRYNKVEDAVKLYESLMKEPLVVQGRTIRCDFDAERPASIKTMDGRPSTCLMLDHLPMDKLRRPDSIYRAMLPYGDVQDVRMARGVPDGRLLGPVYVEYSSIEEATAAERALNSGELASKIGGVQVVARFAAELHQLPISGNVVPSRTLYLGRVPSKVLLFKRSLLQPFEAYGPVVDLRIPMEDGWPKGYCYIEFEKLSDAVEACEDLQTKNQLMFYGKPLHVAYASPRAERSRLVPESVRSYGGQSNNTDRMKLLEEHLNTPVDRSRMEESPRQGIATSDETAPTGHSPKSPSRDPWGKYGFKDNR